jgi:4-alpha-glucanotransferase
VQLHITSLPGGRLGPQAYRFVDWLASAGQSWWQVLPLGPPDRYRSPYKSSSAFAAWPGLLADRRAPVSAAEISEFRERQRFWIEDWERFSARGAVADQVRFDREWGALRAYARDRRVQILGDVAIYVSPGGADHRAHPELFQTGLVAGAPPDAYATDGQLWGNPLYDWPALQRRGYRWWVERVRRTLDLFDLARIDHFRGLVAYWAVPAGERTAKNGTWKRGPGRALFRALEAGLDRRLPPSRDAGDPVRDGSRRPDEPAPPGQPHRRPDRLHGHP